MKAKNILLGIGAMLGLLLPGLQASEWDKKTIITFPEAVEIPGRVLPAGEYVIKRADESLPNVIQITNPEETEVFATVQALPTIRQKPSDKVEVVTEERPVGSPEALKKWFYPGDLTGAEFVYPDSDRNLLAAATAPSLAEQAPSGPPAVEPSSEEAQPLSTAEEEEEAPIAERQSEEPVEVAQARPPAAPAPGTTQAQPAPSRQQAPSAVGQAQEPTQEEELPQTATSLTLASLLGGLAVFGGAALRKLSRRLG
jgi:hypothetical protein